MEYSLKVNGKEEALWLKELLETKNLEYRYINKKHNSLSIDEFDLANGLRISVYENNFPPNHPAATYETMFQEEDFVYEQTISYELENNEQFERCYKTMYEVSFSILESLKVDGLFYPSGEEIFFYRDGKYTFNGKYLELLEDQYSEILKSINYTLFGS